MNAFEYASPSSLGEAIGLLSDSWGETEVLAGGTDLITSLKQDITKPGVVVSLKNVRGLAGIDRSGDTLHIGAMTTLSALIGDDDVQEHFPALVTAARNIGSHQILNTGTVGGDLLQRPRCWYFRQGFGLFGTDSGTSLVPDGDNRYHAIFGNKGPAYFVNPSSLAPGLIALDAQVTVHGPDGDRVIALSEFFATPRSETDREYVMKPNEILTRISIPVQDLRNATYEIRPRRGLDWPMVTASVAFKLSDPGPSPSARNARVVLGHVAPTPWVAEKAAKALEGLGLGRAAGGEFHANRDAIRKVGEAAASGANPLSRNGYKVAQVKVAVVRAINEALPTG